MRYDGFISYSHAADGRLAPALQKALQRLAKPWYRRRSLEIFRDETGLSVDPHLWGAIVKALDDAEWFVLLTSPLAARSEWVNREIEHWKANRPVDRILPVVTDGRWEWDEQTADFTAESDAVPPALRGVFTDEPRHLDLRWAHDEEQLDLRDSRFRNAVAEVAAPLHGRTKDEIEGEDVRQHRRTVRIAWSAAATLAVLTVAAVVAGGIAVVNANRAEQRRVQAEAQRLAAQSQTLLERPDLAFLLAAQGYRLDPNVGTQSALLTAVANTPEMKERIPTGVPVAAVATSDAADRVWIGTTDGDIVVNRFSDGQQVGRVQGVFNREIVAMALADDRSVVATDGTVVNTVDDAADVTTVRTPDHAVFSLAVDTATGRIAAGTIDGMVLVWEREETQPTARFAGMPLGGDLTSITALAWSPDGALIVAGQDGGLRRYNVDAPDKPVWEQNEIGNPDEWTSALTVVDDGTVVAGGTDGSVSFWNAATGAMTDAGRSEVHLDTVRGLVPTGDPPEGGSVASVSDDGYLLYWNHLTGSAPLPPVRVDEQAATSVGWDPANPNHGVTGGQAGGAVLFDYGDDERRPLAHPANDIHDASTVAVSPAADRLAVARVAGWRPAQTHDGQVEITSELMLTNPANPNVDGPKAPLDAAVKRLAFTTDGTRVLAGTDHGTVAVWDGNSTEVTLNEVAPDQPVNRLAVSPDGNTIATGGLDGNARTFDSATVRLWRLDGDKLVEQGRIDNAPFGFGLAFTPDGSRLVIGGANKLAIHSLADGKTTTIDLPNESVRSMAVTADGAMVAVGLFSGPVRLIDLRSGQATGDDLRVASRVSDMAFEDTGDVLVTVSEDGSLIMWDLASRSRLSDRPLTTVDRNAVGTKQMATSLAVARDIAVTASIADGRVATWSLNPDDWIAEGCSVHKRELSDAEKDRFGLSGAAPICPTD
ncbi:TIR domain-containing protein [Mycolicibacterium moriokaense]|nr:TIR domain-containing protein [Mycolicibacterium moriokaense]